MRRAGPAVRKLRRITTAVFAAVLLIGSRAVANAADGKEPADPAPTVHSSSEPRVLGGNVIEDGPTASAPPIDAEELARQGITGEVVSVEQDVKGATFYFYEDGDYVFMLPDELPNEDGDLVRAAWSAGTYCTGHFVQIAKLNGQLYWGGQNYCSGTNNVYQHDLRIVLRDGCTGPFCFQEETGSARAPGSAYEMVKTVSQFHTCVNSNQRRYDMIAYPMVRSVQFGPIVDSENFIVACDWI